MRVLPPENLQPLCPRVQKIFSLFAEHPDTIQHLLLYGPPGSGKTTTVQWLLNKIWGNRQIQTCRVMNAADERSLDAIRAKLVPFVSTDWRMRGETSPRFLVLDECETLTESAQLALRPFLDNSPQDISIIFICNSLSRVHASLRTRCLRIRFDPPKTESLQSMATRGDLRPARSSRDDITNAYAYIHGAPNKMTWYEMIQALLFIVNSCGLFDEELQVAFRPVFLSGTETIPLGVREQMLGDLRMAIRQKLEGMPWATNRA
jgi:hypothetical protein